MLYRFFTKKIKKDKNNDLMLLSKKYYGDHNQIKQHSKREISLLFSLFGNRYIPYRFSEFNESIKFLKNKSKDEFAIYIASACSVKKYKKNFKPTSCEGILIITNINLYFIVNDYEHETIVYLQNNIQDCIRVDDRFIEISYNNDKEHYCIFGNNSSLFSNCLNDVIDITDNVT